MAASLEKRNPARGKPTLGGVLLVLSVFVFGSYFLLPFYWLLVSSGKDNGQLFGTFSMWFASPWNLGANIADLVNRQNGVFGHWLLNSILIASGTCVLSTLAAAAGGFAFSKYRFKGRNLLFNIILGTVMVPSTALALPIFLLMNKLGLINTLWAVILPGVVNPFGLYLMRLFWDQSFPTELLEAARIDGASDARTFWLIGMPLVRGGLTTVGLFSFAGAWNNFFLPLIVLSRDELLPLTVGLSIWNAASAGSSVPLYGMIIVGSIISVLPLVIAFLSLQRYWQGGLTFGATKG
jgi:multiple sugar transport system permease protein